jgi:diguanylate cyclase (GGDEF)-like protein/PAS domain S-box-containing protein
MDHRLGRPAIWLAVAVGYWLLGMVGLHWAQIQENTSVIWPASGLALAAAFLFGPRVWPGIFLGAAAVVLTTSAPSAAILAIALGNTLEPLAGLWLYRRLAGSGDPLGGPDRTLRFMAAGGLAGPLLSAGFGALALGALAGVPLAELPWIALTWWMGNVAGVLLVAPALLSGMAPRHANMAPRSAVEWLGLMLATTLVAGLAFGWVGMPAEARYPLAYLPFPVVVWAALRFGQRGGTAAMLLVAAVAVLSTTLGLGPFVRPAYLETYWLLVIYVIVGAATMLLVTAVIRERAEQRLALARARDELEDRVAERTQALQAANAALEASESHLRLVVTEAPLVLWSTDAAGRFTFIQGRGLAALGLRPDELLGRSVADVFPASPELAAQCVRALGGETVQASATIGARRHELHAVPLRRGDGRVQGAIGVCLDITERAQAEEKLRLDATVFANTTEGVMITDAHGAILAVNAAFTEITGYAESEALGRNPRMLRSERHGTAFYRELWRTILEQGRWQGEVWNRRKSGEIYPEWLSISAVRDETGELSHFVGVFSDISSIKFSQRQLDFLAYHDPLTGLPNRLLFNERLGHAIQRAERERRQLAVLFLDLDHFKHVNDSLGHPVGDQLLVEVARRLGASVRGEDTVARLGGDEFVVLVEDIQDAADAAVVASKLLDACRRPVSLTGRDLYVAGSVGISLYPRDGRDAEHLVKNADAALYLAKQEGRDAFRFYTAELTQRALERVELEAELRVALAEGQFELRYQPQVCLVTGQVLAVEALLRWRHPRRGLLAPAAFLGVAEESGLILPIGAWALRAACRQMADWLAEGLALEQIAVNLSSQQIEREGLEDAVRVALADAGLSPYFLELEITEGALALDRAEAQLRALKELGLRVSVDDFGTGFSSLSYLRHLPLDGLKIDRAFVGQCDHNPDNAAIIASVVALGRGLRLTVVAEGVETEAELDCLRRLGCDVAQGYLTGPPLAATEVARLLVRNH